MSGYLEDVTSLDTATNRFLNISSVYRLDECSYIKAFLPSFIFRLDPLANEGDLTLYLPFDKRSPNTSVGRFQVSVPIRAFIEAMYPMGYATGGAIGVRHTQGVAQNVTSLFLSQRAYTFPFVIKAGLVGTGATNVANKVLFNMQGGACGRVRISGQANGGVGSTITFNVNNLDYSGVSHTQQIYTSAALPAIYDFVTPLVGNSQILVTSNLLTDFSFYAEYIADTQL